MAKNDFQRFEAYRVAFSSSIMNFAHLFSVLGRKSIILDADAMTHSMRPTKATVVFHISKEALFSEVYTCQIANLRCAKMLHCVHFFKRDVTSFLHILKAQIEREGLV